jgi:hypothetical protein
MSLHLSVLVFIYSFCRLFSDDSANPDCAASKVMVNNDRAIAQVVNLRLHTAVVRVRSQVMSYMICGGQSCIGAGFLRVLRLHMPILIPLNASQSSIALGRYERPISGRRNKWTQFQSNPKELWLIMTTELNGSGRQQLWSNLKYYPNICLEGL